MPPSPPPGALTLATAADDAYALPLAVLVRSALDCLSADRTLRLFVLDGGLAPASRERLLASWDDPRLDVAWVAADPRRLAEMPVFGHVTVATYYRLLLAELLPAGVGRALYLDPDMLVRRCLGALWDEPQGGAAALAVQDQGAPWFDAGAGGLDLARCGPLLASARPVANYRELGLPAGSPYLNGGLLVADLDRWRREGLAHRFVDAMTTHRQHALWWDQYALNVGLCSAWRAVDPRWNQSAHVYAYPTWRDSPLDRETFGHLRADPWVVHFSSPYKPWGYFCDHPFRGEFLSVLARTAWRGWRPERPRPYLRALWRWRYKPARAALKWRLSRLTRGLSGRAA